MDIWEQKPLAIGLEMPAGQWILEADGTLHFSGGDMLIGGAFGNDRKRVKRILIEDFWFVAEHLFESFPECEEVVFKRSYVQISSMAFAHCPKLARVKYEDAEIAEDAFRDTPYEAAQKGVPYIPEGEQEHYIGSGAYGKKFLELMHQVTEDMKTMPGPTKENYDWQPDDRDWFEDCISAVGEGRRAGEPGMMFLFAELFHYCSYFACYCTVEEFEEWDKDSNCWYLKAAKAGSPHAILWCAWCMEEGIEGFEKDPISSAAMLNSLREVPKTLGLSELAFLKDELLSMVEQAYDADREEDMLGDMYHYEKEKYEELLPDPDWRTLHLRYVQLGRMMVQMGLPYVLEKCGYEYRWDHIHIWEQSFQDTADQIKREKTGLLDWCRGKGMEISLT